MSRSIRMWSERKKNQPQKIAKERSKGSAGLSSAVAELTAAGCVIMPLSQVLSNLRIYASFPFFILYYLLYSSFDYNDPEGRVTDTKVKRETESNVPVMRCCTIRLGQVGNPITHTITISSSTDALANQSDESNVTSIPNFVFPVARCALASLHGRDISLALHSKTDSQSFFFLRNTDRSHVHFNVYFWKMVW